MNFDSLEFLFCFLPISLIFFWYFIKIKKENLAILSIIICSLFFYAWFELKFLPLIILSILFNYFYSKLFSNTKIKSKKNILIFGIFINIIILVIFKYSNFVIVNINQFVDNNFVLLNLIFPLALSFYTLQQITFLVDSYQNQGIKVSLKKYFLYVSFFPQLIAGPIVLFNQVNNQWDNILKSDKILENFYKGLFFIAIGLFKKVVISQKLSIMANLGFDNYENISLVSSWISSICFTLQFYFDFSAYSDIAIGLALLFNIKLPINFNSPLKSYSVQEFWTRWHITLSNFINFYMFIPTLRLFNNLTLIKTVFSIIIIMTIIGFWHGPSYNYIIFGLLHGIALAINTVLKNKNITLIPFKDTFSNKFLCWLITFLFINITFIFFRSETLIQSLSMSGAFFGKNSFFESDLLIEYIINSLTPKIILFSFFLIFLKNSSEIVNNLKINVQNSILLSSLFLIITYVIMYNSEVLNKFIYFNF